MRANLKIFSEWNEWRNPSHTYIFHLVAVTFAKSEFLGDVTIELHVWILNFDIRVEIGWDKGDRK